MVSELNVKVKGFLRESIKLLYYEDKKLKIPSKFKLFYKNIILHISKAIH